MSIRLCLAQCPDHFRDWGKCSKPCGHTDLHSHPNLSQEFPGQFHLWRATHTLNFRCRSCGFATSPSLYCDNPKCRNYGKPKV